jgi:hypothetical protein
MLPVIRNFSRRYTSKLRKVQEGRERMKVTQGDERDDGGNGVGMITQRATKV